MTQQMWPHKFPSLHKQPQRTSPLVKNTNEQVAIIKRQKSQKKIEEGGQMNVKIDFYSRQ